MNQINNNLKIISNEKENIRKILQAKENELDKKASDIVNLIRELEEKNQELEETKRKIEDLEVENKDKIEIEKKKMESHVIFRKKLTKIIIF